MEEDRDETLKIKRLAACKTLGIPANKTRSLGARAASSQGGSDNGHGALRGRRRPRTNSGVDALVAGAARRGARAPGRVGRRRGRRRGRAARLALRGRRPRLGRAGARGGRRGRRAAVRGAPPRVAGAGARRRVLPRRAARRGKNAHAVDHCGSKLTARCPRRCRRGAAPAAPSRSP